MAVGQKAMVPFWGRCTTHFRTYFSGDWDVHWGYDLDFDPRPCTRSSEAPRNPKRFLRLFGLSSRPTP